MELMSFFFANFTLYIGMMWGQCLVEMVVR